MQNIILASQSPRRKQLLEWAEVPFEVVIQDTDESYPTHLSPSEVVMHIANNKAKAVAEKVGQAKTILAADTIVVLEDEIIGKPANREAAIAILLKLSGKTHLVITGVALLFPDGRETCFAEVTEVTFNALTEAQLTFYVDKYAPYDKAGAYAIQEWIGVVGIQSVAGDFYNVMGLPVNRVVKHLV